jgi:hypothetical protein
VALAAEEAEAAEGVAVQPDRRPKVGKDIGVVGQGLLGQLDVGETDDRMGPLAVWPGQAELAGEGDELALVVVLAASRGVFDPADMGEGVDGLVEHGLQGLVGAFGQALAGDEQLRLAPGRRRVEGGALALFGGVAFDPVVGAEVAPLGVDVEGARRQAGAGHDHDLRELGGAAADVGPGLFEGGDETGAGLLDGSHRTSSGPFTCGDWNFLTGTGQEILATLHTLCGSIESSPTTRPGKDLPIVAARLAGVGRNGRETGGVPQRTAAPADSSPDGRTAMDEEASR